MEKYQNKHSIIKKINFLSNKVFFILGIVFIVVIWFLLSKVENNILVPSIYDVINKAKEIILEIDNIKLIFFTLLKLLTVLSISFIIGFIIGVFAYKYTIIKSFVSPIMAFMRTIPVASFVVILLIVIGNSLTPIIITMFVLIPICYESTYLSLVTIDKEYIEETKMITNINLKVIIILFIPMTMRSIISILLSSLGLGLKVLIMSEVITQGEDTIGGKIQLSRSWLDYTSVFAWTLILILLVLIIEEVIKIIKNKILKE